MMFSDYANMLPCTELIRIHGTFFRGSREEVFGLADALKIGVSESDLPTSGGFDHSGTFLVVNPDQKVTYFVTGDGTEDHEIDDLICFLQKH